MPAFQHSISINHVIKALASQSLAELVEYEVVTIRHLMSKIKSSFTAGVSTNLLPPMIKAEHSNEYPLPEAPALVMGVLESSITSSSSRNEPSYCGIVLADATGKIPCNVCYV